MSAIQGQTRSLASPPQPIKRWASTTPSISSRRKARRSFRRTCKKLWKKQSKCLRQTTRMSSQRTSSSTVMAWAMQCATKFFLQKSPSLKVLLMSCTTRQRLSHRLQSLWSTSASHRGFLSRTRKVVCVTLLLVVLLTKDWSRMMVKTTLVACLISSWRQRTQLKVVFYQLTFMSRRTIQILPRSNCSSLHSPYVTSITIGPAQLRFLHPASTHTRSQSSSWSRVEADEDNQKWSLVSRRQCALTR